MADPPVVDVGADISAGLKAVEVLKYHIQGVSSTVPVVAKQVEEVEKNATQSRMRILGRLQQTIGIADALFRAIGVNMTMQQRLLIRSVFAAARVLTPIFSAMLAKAAGTPYDPLSWSQAIQAGIGIANIGVAVASAVAYESGARDDAIQMAALTEGLSGINMMIGTMSFN